MEKVKFRVGIVWIQIPLSVLVPSFHLCNHLPSHLITSWKKIEKILSVRFSLHREGKIIPSRHSLNTNTKYPSWYHTSIHPFFIPSMYQVISSQVAKILNFDIWTSHDRGTSFLRLTFYSHLNNIFAKMTEVQVLSDLELFTTHLILLSLPWQRYLKSDILVGTNTLTK